ncbi:hypothetical protein ACFWUZ_26505 [Streptomyces sp. NPDC058646]|uniref:hypothetical protein n=1 Tax=Streptomyces sp. NPDC058646 TaxID=3346574 RepID=UPI0036646DF2
MAHVKGHFRKDGTYVRPHTRRSRPKSAHTIPPQRGSSRPPLPQDVVPTTGVRGHYRADGTYVRPHRRRVGAPAATVAAAGGGGLMLLILILAALGGGGGGGGAPQTSNPSAPAPAVATSAGLPR